MSTKNIARTAIEGGRTGSYKRDVWIAKRSERAQTRNELSRILKDVDAAEERPFPVRDPVRKDFADKLCPAMRWLSKKTIGMTAAEIRGLLLATFDTRSLAGRHLLFDHLMPRQSIINARFTVPIYLGYAQFELDENGVLQEVKKRPTEKKPSKKLRIRARQWIKTIHEHQRIGEKNGDYFVFEKTATYHDVECTDRHCISRTTDYRLVGDRYQKVPFVHPTRCMNGSDSVPYHTVPLYRSVRKLVAREVELWLVNPVRLLDLVKNP